MEYNKHADNYSFFTVQMFYRYFISCCEYRLEWYFTLGHTHKLHFLVIPHFEIFHRYSIS